MTFDPTILLLSLFIGIASFYLSFDLIERLNDEITPHNKTWTLIGTFSLGLGIWTMHFFGMFAFNMADKFGQNYLLTTLSITFALLCSYIVIKLNCKVKKKKYYLILSGAILSFSVMSLHFFSMGEHKLSTMKPEIALLWLIVFLTSTVICCYPFRMLYVSRNIHSIYHGKKVLSAIVIGITIVVIHLITMIFPLTPHNEMGIHTEEHFHEPILILSIIISALIVLIPTIFVAHFDRKTMQKLAYYDHLTDIPNRRYAEKQFEKLISIGEKKDCLNAILFFDCDRLKFVNDTYGHEVGDHLLKVFSTRVKKRIASSDLFARMGGDEFILLISNTNKKEVEKLAQAVILDMQTPFYHNEIEINFSTSIGINLFKGFVMGKDTLIKQADQALYMAKEAGKNNYQFYNDQIKETMRKDLLSKSISTGIVRNEFYVEYQPQINIKDGIKVTSFEALLRWTHPNYGNVSPVEFIPISEKNGDILELTKYVLREACNTVKLFKRDCLQDIKVAVNISPILVKNNNLVDTILTILKEQNTKPSSIILEITETVFMEDKEQMINVFRKLQGMGMLIAIDDFGTGFSSLSYLKHLPVNILKIDRQFIKNSTKDLKVKELNDLIVKIGHTFHLSVIAEGVETLEELEIIKENNCDGAQGFYFGRPTSLEEIMKAMHKKKLKNEA
jgi:diguanylate cyclase